MVVYNFKIDFTIDHCCKILCNTKLVEINKRMGRFKSNGYDAIKTESLGPSFTNGSFFERTCVKNISDGNKEKLLRLKMKQLSENRVLNFYITGS